MVLGRWLQYHAYKNNFLYFEYLILDFHLSVCFLKFSMLIFTYFLSERSEPSGQPNQQLKKRRRKDLEKGHPENHDARLSNKHTKVGKTTTGKSALMVAKNFSNLSQNMAITHEHLEDDKLQNQLNVPGHSSKKKSGDTKMILDPSPSSKVYNGDTSTSVAEAKDTDPPKPGVFPSKNLGSKSKESCGPSDSLQQNILEKIAHAPSKPQPGRPCTDEIDSSIQMKEKHGIRELPDINLPEGKYSMQTAVSFLKQLKR